MGPQNVEGELAQDRKVLRSLILSIAGAIFVAEARRSVARVETGSFRRMMKVELVNDGPVTILLDSRKQF